MTETGVTADPRGQGELRGRPHRVFVTGATGFVGKLLVHVLLERGHGVVALVRPRETAAELPPGVQIVTGDATRKGPWWDAVSDCSAAVNLAGEPIMTRWDRCTKAAILESRVACTRNLVDAVPAAGPFILVSASGVGYYGEGGDRLLTEEAPPGRDFMAQVARRWEAEALAARGKGARVVLARFGVVLDRGGGALDQLERTARRLPAGPAGRGRQWVSWIHRQDLVRALCFLLESPDAEGAYNLGSPEPVRQADLARAAGRALGLPLKAPPAFALRLLLGEAAEAVLASQRMFPERLLSQGFRFRHGDLTGALNAIFPAQTPPPQRA